MAKKENDFKAWEYIDNNALLSSRWWKDEVLYPLLDILSGEKQIGWIKKLSNKWSMFKKFINKKTGFFKGIIAKADVQEYLDPTVNTNKEAKVRKFDNPIQKFPNALAVLKAKTKSHKPRPPAGKAPLRNKKKSSR